MAEKERADILLVERGLCETRERAKSSIMSGIVYANGQKTDKAGQMLPRDCALELRGSGLPYVSRGGLKLEKALDSFPISVEGLRCLDAGASTGGFTDCMLQRGAAKVWAADVGYGQLAWSLRNDPRVVVLERTNARHLTREILGDIMDFAAADLSFISLRLVLPALRSVLREDAWLVTLVKPQFEAGRDRVGKNGVVRDREVHLEVLLRFREDAEKAGFSLQTADFSPIRGPKGNIEFLAGLKANGDAHKIDREELEGIVAAAHDGN